MPRLPWRLIARAWKEHTLLPLLLRPCRDLSSARRELKWIGEHARNVARRTLLTSWQAVLHRCCLDRARGKPLQYILGTEFFGELELKCRPGVLIPRQETATYVLHLLDLLDRNAAQLPSKLKVLDLCTGSGCIPLLFAHSFPTKLHGSTVLELTGVDISKRAMSLANLNKVEQAALCPNTSIRDVEFLRADILSTNISSPVPLLRDVLHNRGQTRWDILISNPPYISPEQFNSVTARSVRNFEPKVALVPDADHSYLSDHEHGDLFYPQLLKIARELNVKVLLMEVGDLEQAKRVAGRAQVEGRWDGVEIWRDVPAAADEDESSWDYIGIRGQGNGRSVVCWTLSAQKWIGKHQ